MRALQALQQNLDAAAAFLLPEQPRRQHARIVEHQQIIGFEQIRQIAHHAVGENDLLRRHRPRQQKPRRAALGEREAGD